MAIPTDFAGLISWHEALNQTEADGATVTSLLGLGGTPNGANQTDSAKRPIVTLLFNGKRVYRFDNVDDVIRIGADLTTRPFTIVTRYMARVGLLTGKRTISHGTGGANWLVGQRNESGTAKYGYFNNAFIHGTALDEGILHTHSVRQQAAGTIAEYRIDGVAQGTNTQVNVPGQLTFGYAGEPAFSDVIGICIYNVWLADADLASIEAYWVTQGGTGPYTNPGVRATQAVVEGVTKGAAPLRSTQSVLEVIAAVPPPALRVTQDVMEVLVRYGARSWSQIIY